MASVYPRNLNDLLDRIKQENGNSDDFANILQLINPAPDQHFWGYFIHPSPRIPAQIRLISVAEMEQMFKIRLDPSTLVIEVTPSDGPFGNKIMYRFVGENTITFHHFSELGYVSDRFEKVYLSVISWEAYFGKSHLD